MAAWVWPSLDTLACSLLSSQAGLGSKFSAGVVLGALSGLLASPFDLVRIRTDLAVLWSAVPKCSWTIATALLQGSKLKLADVAATASLQLDFARGILKEFGVQLPDMRRE